MVGVVPWWTRSTGTWFMPLFDTRPPRRNCGFQWPAKYVSSQLGHETRQKTSEDILFENDWTIRAGKLPFTSHRPMIARQFDLRRCWRSWFHTVQRNAKGGIYLHFSVPDGWIRPKSNMISVGWFAMCFDCRRLDVLSSQCMGDSATVHSIMPLHDGRHLEELWPACLWFLMCFWLDPKLEPELYHSIIFIVSEFHNFMYTYDIYVHIIILLISHPPVRWSWWPITTCTRR